jgi:hypothetical protein
MSGAPVVVQGTAVPSYPSAAPSRPPPTAREEVDGKRSSGCKDPLFALLFYGCIASIVTVAAIYGQEAFVASDDGLVYQNYVWVRESFAKN